MLRAMLLLGIAAAALRGARNPEKLDLFVGGTGGYKTYRIPAVVVTAKGSVLAFCAARKDFGDWSDIDIALRRSTDGGKTWSVMRIIAGASAGTTDNPTPIADRDGTVHFLYQTNYARIFYIRSTDDGRTFSAPVDLTPVVEGFRSEYKWAVIAPGPGHAIQLRNGRLLVPLWLSPDHSHRPSVIATIHSDDRGTSWRRGQLLAPSDVPNPSENMPVELSDGHVMINIRNESPRHRRAVSFSSDGAGGWSKPVFDEELYEPVCMASILRLRTGGILFSNPRSESDTEAIIAQYRMRPRNNLTIRMSNDDGRTWPVARLLEPGRTGYSDLAEGPEGSLYCLYEQGVPDHERLANRNIRIARFGLDWLIGH